MEDTFTIPVSFDEFVTWLNGHARRTNVLPAQVMTLDGRTAATVTAHGAQYAFTVQDEDDARTTLHAELWSGIEPAPEAKQWYADTLQAIRRRYGQDPMTTEDDQRALVRRANAIQRSTGKTWAQIAEDLGTTDRNLRKLRNKFGDV